MRKIERIRLNYYPNCFAKFSDAPLNAIPERRRIDNFTMNAASEQATSTYQQKLQAI
jgi:hypothetical protein